MIGHSRFHFRDRNCICVVCCPSAPPCKRIVCEEIIQERQKANGSTRESPVPPEEGQYPMPTPSPRSD